MSTLVHFQAQGDEGKLTVFGAPGSADLAVQKTLRGPTGKICGGYLDLH